MPSPAPSEPTEAVPASAAPPTNVAKRAVKGAAWFTAARFIAHGVRLLRLLVLAHLLGAEGPALLGVFGVAALALATVEALSQTGLQQALIQKKDDVSPYLPTAWTTQLGRGLLLGALLFGLAPWIAGAMDKPAAVAPMQALALTPILRGLNSIGVLFFAKDLKFKKTFVMEVGIAVVDLTVCIIAAVIEPSVWALVYGNLAGFGFGAAISYVLSERPTRPGFSWPQLRELSGFGSWIFVASLIGFAMTSGGDAVVGVLLPAAQLGIYQMASKLATMPAMELSRVIAAVTFPAFSLLQTDRARMADAFLKSFFFAGVLSVGAAGGVMVIAADVVALFLPPGWEEAAPAMQWLAIWGACRGLGASHSTLLQAAGRPGLAALFPGLSLVAFAIAVVPVTEAAGMVGVCQLLAAIGVGAQVGRYPVIARVLGIGSWAIYARTLVSVSALLVGLGLGRWLDGTLGDVGHVARLLALALTYTVGYALTLAVWNVLSPYRVLPVVLEIVKTVGRRRRPA
jgi:lipopolysaccharide exporter